jgi:hypothetical protein
MMFATRRYMVSILSAPLSDVRFEDRIQNSTYREDYSVVNAPNTEKLSL